MILFIDTHLNDIVVLLYKDGAIIKKRTVTNEKENSKLIMPIIKKILNKQVPESIIVVNGPGSFTGVRIGVTIAKTLAYTYEIPIRTITSLECMAVSTIEDEKIVGFSDNNGYYVGIYDDEYNLIGNLEYLNNEQFAQFQEKYHVILDEQIDYVRVIKYALTKEATNAHEVNPLYVKKLDVEK